jgi:hypothetical protein
VRRAANRNKFHQGDPQVSEHRVFFCGGKRQYETWTVADRMARSTSRNTDTRMGVYKCRKCAKWHVGTAAPKEASRKRA